MGVSNHSHCDHGMAECGRLAKQKADTAIITINPSGTIQSVDKNCCDMFGYRMEELLGQPVSIFIPPPYREQHDTYLHNYHETGKAKIIGRSRNVEGQHKDGTIFTIRLSVSEIKIPGSTIYVGMIDKLENKTAYHCRHRWYYYQLRKHQKNMGLRTRRIDRTKPLSSHA